MKKVTPYDEWTPNSPDSLNESSTYMVAIQDEPKKISEMLKELGAKILKVFDFGIIHVEMENSKVPDAEKIPGVERVEKEKIAKSQ